MRAVQKQLREGLIVRGRYEVERLLGTQDTGFVYLCRDLASGKARTRMKLLSAAGLDSGVTESLSLEFSLLRRLRHPNLVRILDFGILENSGELFLVEEWVDGKDVFSATEGMDPDKIVNVVIELSKTLHYLHARGIVHGGLNPSNAILSRAGETRQLKVLDFGLKHRLPVLATSGGIGTLAYMAPEILMGGTENESSDLYSFGILMYQLLTRRLPFEDADPGFLVQKHLQVSVDLHPIERLKGGQGLSELLCRLLDKDPLKRPASSEVITRLVRDVLDLDSPEIETKELENYFSASRFVGRETEMLQLQKCAARVRANGRGWTVFVSGEAGSGKTRCLEEFGSWALLEGWRVIEGTCGTNEEGSYGPYRQILAKTAPMDGVAIFQFDDLPRVAESGAFDFSSEFAAGQFRDRLTRELIRRFTEKPTLLLLHDFHLADEATNTVLDYLSSDIQAHPILICVSARSGEEAKPTLTRFMEMAVRQERGEILSLEPLTKKNVEQLVAGMTGDSCLKESLGSWMYESIGGNPFFLEEMLKHLVEQGILRRALDRWQFMDHDLPKLEIPASVSVVLRRRLVQLSPVARELANWLALFHRPVSSSLLCSVAFRNTKEISEPLQELKRRQMIRVDMKDARECVEYCHALISEVILGDLRPNVRRRMHRRIAEVLDREYRTESHLQEIAMHHMEGQSGPAAVRYALALASQYRSEFAHEKALHCFHYVFKNGGDLTQDELCLAAIEASNTMFALGMPKRAIHLLQSEMRKNRSIGVDRKALMFMQLALAYQHFGDLRLQELWCKKGLSLFPNRGNGKANLTKAMLLAELAFGAVLKAQPKRGLAFLDRALRLCPDPNMGALAARIQYLKAYLHRAARNLHKALSECEKAASILALCEESYLTCSGYSTLGSILMGLGRFSLALEKHRQAVLLSEKSRSVILKSQALGNMVECLCRMGHMPEAVEAAELAVKSVTESNNPAINYAFKTILAELQLATGDYGKAIKILGQLEKNTAQNSVLYASGHALYVAASSYFILGSFDTALEHIENLRRIQIRGAPFYEYELAEALKARILFERGQYKKAIRSLNSIDKEVTKKHWPYHMCIIKLHLAEVLIKRNALGPAERHAKNSLRLARGMQSIPLISHSHLLLGMITSLSNRSPAADKTQCERAIKELQSASTAVNSSFLGDTALRAHAELSFLFKQLSYEETSLDHAKKAYELLCKLGNQVPSDMLASYYDAFDRNRVKSELIPIIESGRVQKQNTSIAVAEIPDFDKSRILLRVSAAVNSILDLNKLFEEILDQLISAVGVERAFVLLRDESTGKLQLAKGRNCRQESLLGADLIRGNVLEEVCEQGRPIVSADVRNDPRFSGWDAFAAGGSGRLLCAPLKVSDRVLGLLYADHSSPAESLSESVINLFAAFCNLAAIAIDNALAHQQLVREKSELEQYLHQARDGYLEIVGKSAAVESMRDRIGLAAGSPLDILITGESGTGKELVARAIYRTGRRKSGKFVAVDCGSLSDSLAEAELFGYRKGAFTGALENRQGLLESAQGGTIFLDEISNLPFGLQAKFLRVLQEREVRRIGETMSRSIDVQVIAATNKDLLEEMRVGKFRNDLYYRLKIMEIRVPPLRDRSEDIPLLIEWFLEKIAQSEGRKSKQLSPQAKEMLKGYRYPGNIRELKNIVSNAYYSAKGNLIRPDELPSEVHRANSPESASESEAAGLLYLEIVKGKGDFEELVKGPFLRHDLGASLVREVVGRALKDSGGKYSEAFALLGIPDHRYSLIMRFLKRNRCYLDYRPFRRLSPRAPS
jgi:transcriptional regulator with GAF, ATPase, and Fis domain